MVRGKHAAKAARQRAEAAAASLSEVERRFAQYREETTAQLRELRADKQKLHDQLLNHVEELAGQQLEQERQRHREETEQLEQAHHATLVELMELLWNDTTMDRETLHTAMDIANVKMGEIPTAATRSHADRSTRRHSSRAAARVSRETIRRQTRNSVQAARPVIGLVPVEPDGEPDNAAQA